ncbi:MAG: hypothetical protein LQ352_001482 [Teloschistes flavicans]|nr:MAG: hypothetical protein LQ352_001482 [Teloschistes flavicans]
MRRCSAGDTASCDDLEECHVPDTSTTMILAEKFNKISAYGMQTILDNSQAQVRQRMAGGNQPPPNPPWNYTARGLMLVAGFEGWDWELLNNSIEGLRYCMFRKGKFEEVHVRRIVDPTALNPDGKRYLFLLTDSTDMSNTTLPKDVVEHCYIPETHTRLLYELQSDIGAYNMQQLLALASSEVDSRIATQGKNQRTAVPWVVETNGLVLNATFNGWSWQVLQNTIRALRICLFQKGIFREVNVLDTTDPVALLGQRYLRLTKG